jgi:hypothetical protein
MVRAPVDVALGALEKLTAHARRIDAVVITDVTG